MDNFDDAELIHWQWVEISLKNCAREIREAMEIGRRGNKRPATDLGECVAKQARTYLPVLPNTTCMVGIHQVSNGNDIVVSPN